MADRRQVPWSPVACPGSLRWKVPDPHSLFWVVDGGILPLDQPLALEKLNFPIVLLQGFLRANGSGGICENASGASDMFIRQVQSSHLLVCSGGREPFTGHMRTRAWHGGLGLCAERAGGIA